MAKEFCATTVRPMNFETDLEDVTAIWNEIVREGEAFPQTEELSLGMAEAFFRSQVAVGVAEVVCEQRICGLYILHPNNVGRCVQIGNASYAVTADMRGKRLGEMLVRDSIVTARDAGFRALQFNAVVASNAAARHLYSKLGFDELGKVPDGFRKDDGSFEDVYIYVYDLTK